MEFSRIKRAIFHGAVENLPTHEPFTEIKVRQNGLSVHRGCILWGSRVLVSRKLRPHLFKLLHKAHQGMGRTKLHAVMSGGKALTER